MQGNRIDGHENWERDISRLLEDLSDAQDELLEVLSLKRQYMAANHWEQMRQLEPREQSLCERLQCCHQRRQQLLASAEHRGLPASSLGELAAAIGSSGDKLRNQVKQAASRVSLLQHQSLTNWVVAQRTLLHLSQMLEIIASGGRIKPTYGNEGTVGPSGALVDQQA